MNAPLILRFDEICAVLSQRIDSTCDERGKAVVAIDGPDCSGKSTLCRALVTLLKGKHPVIPIHYDDYLNVKAVREARGAFDTDAFLYDYFDERALIRSVLEPSLQAVSIGQIVIVEGLFLIRERLLPYFTLCIRLEINEELTLERAWARDIGTLGTPEWVRRHYLEQCLPAQRLHRESLQSKNSSCVNVYVHSSDRYGLQA